MQTIYKYSIPINDFFNIELPASAKILTVQIQNNTPCIWALTSTDESTVNRQFMLRGTGHPIADDDVERFKYVGTFQLHDGQIVFHLFEEI